MEQATQSRTTSFGGSWQSSRKGPSTQLWPAVVEWPFLVGNSELAACAVSLCSILAGTAASTVAPARKTDMNAIGCSAMVEIVQLGTRGRSSSAVADTATRARSRRGRTHQAWCVERFGLVRRNPCLPQCSFRCSEPYTTRGNLRGAWLTVMALQCGGSPLFHPGNAPSTVS
jgi:hypothetical protein